MIEAFKLLLEKYDKVSIITHRNADADNLGTALGLYALLKNMGKQVEICNIDKKMPNHLDFLPHFAKMKNQINFDNSLIITCNSSNVDLLRFDLSLRKIVNIEHYKFLKDNFEMTKDMATCFYVALLTSTQNFRTLNVDKHMFTEASELISLGINVGEINKNLTQRKSLSSLRVLSATIDTLELYEDAQIVSMVLSQDIIEKTGATSLSDTIGLIDYGMSLVTVKIAILIVEYKDYLDVSFCSDGADVLSLAIHFGGDGDLMASRFRSDELDIDLLLTKIEKQIKKRGLINGS